MLGSADELVLEEFCVVTERLYGCRFHQPRPVLRLQHLLHLQLQLLLLDEPTQLHKLRDAEKEGKDGWGRRKRGVGQGDEEGGVSG